MSFRRALAVACLPMLTACPPAIAGQEHVAALFAQGNELYEAGRFDEAAEAYEKCVQAGADGADVLYNLGNAHARQGRLGHALAAYHAALRVAPRDEDIRHNLRQVEALRLDAPPVVPRSWVAATAARFVERHTLNELTFVALLWAVACTGLGLALLTRRGPRRRLLALLGGCALLLVVSAWAAGARHVRDYVRPPAFVAAPEAAMRSGPGEHFEAVGVLSDGARVTPLTEAGAWVEVVLPTGRRAWLRQEEIAQVRRLRRLSDHEPPA